MTDITVGYHNDRLVAVKESDDPARSARLRHEAELLSRLDHPGVVRLVDFTEGPPAILRTVFVGPDTWLRHAPVGEYQAPALAALIATVADLHETGIAHGALEAAHILVGKKHRPILCGLGDGNTACDAGITDDRRALAAIIDQLGTDDAPLAQAQADLEDPSVSLRAVVRRLDMHSSATVSTNRRFPRLTVPTIERRQFALPTLVITAVLFLGVAALRLASGDESVTTTIPPPPAAPATTTTTAQAPSPSPPAPRPSIMGGAVTPSATPAMSSSSATGPATVCRHLPCFDKKPVRLPSSLRGQHPVPTSSPRSSRLSRVPKASCPTAAPAQISGCAPPEAPESSTSRKADP